MSDDALASYAKEQFTYDGKTRTVYRKGTGPAVVVIAEMPGITPKVVGFADRVVDIGCTAVLPHLFGDPGRDPYEGGALGAISYVAKSMLPACVARDFTVLATGRTSPVIEWLKGLARHEKDRCGGPGVGVIGMCFTGNFALAMAADDSVLAPVLSQPSLPFPVSGSRKRDMAISSADLAKVKGRMADDENLCVLGMRFTNDAFVPADRFARLREELGDRFVGVEIDSSKGNPWNIPSNAHSVVTEHLVDEPGHPTRDALEKVLDLYRTRLSGSGAKPSTT
jgi:dienelactone hydrolase